MFASADDEKGMEKMASYSGPSHVDHQIRQAIQFDWVGLAKDRRNKEELERQIRRIVDRALRDFGDDLQAFGRVNG